LFPDLETKNEQTAENAEINNQKKSLTKSLSSAAFRAGKSYLQRKYDKNK
jgi:maltoporin